MSIFHLVAISGNAKVGRMPVTTTSNDTCPPSCPLQGDGCYAEGGPLAMHWRKVTGGERGGSLAKLCESIAAFPEGQPWRHNQAGDLPGRADKLSPAGVDKLAQAASHTQGFTYTHYPLTDSPHAKFNRRVRNKAHKLDGLTINASANGMAHLDQLIAQGVEGPFATVLPATVNGAVDKTVKTADGHTVIVCPATYKDDVNCKTCMLCASRNRPAVGFPAHGFRTKKASAVAVNMDALVAA